MGDINSVQMLHEGIQVWHGGGMSIMQGVQALCDVCAEGWGCPESVSWIAGVSWLCVGCG